MDRIMSTLIAGAAKFESVTFSGRVDRIFPFLMMG